MSYEIGLLHRQASEFLPIPERGFILSIAQNMKVGLLILLVFATLLSSCQSSCEQKSDTAHVVMLYDVSDSTDAVPQQDINRNGKITNGVKDKKDSSLEGMRAVYLKATKDIFDKLLPGTLIRGCVITDQPLSVTDFPIKGEIPSSSNPLLENKYVREEEMQKIKDEKIREIEKLLKDDNEIEYTCIFDALLLAANSFNGGNATKKHLIIFSDMIEACGAKGSPNYHRFNVTAPHNAGSIIDGLKRAGRLPSLNGVIVYVIGPTGGHRQSDSADRFVVVRNFWEAFFKEVGAEVKRYGAPIEYP